jgi:hypothetical protein
MSNILYSMINRMDYLPGAWPRAVEGSGLVTGRRIDHARTFKHIAIYLEWATFFSPAETMVGTPPEPKLSDWEREGVRIYAIGYETDHGPGTLIDQTHAFSSQNWPRLAEQWASRFKATFITSTNKDVMMALNILGIGPTPDTITRDRIRRHEEEMAAQQHERGEHG